MRSTFLRCSRVAVVFIALGIESVSALVPNITQANIDRIANPIIRTLPDTVSKAWANTRIAYYKDILRLSTSSIRWSSNKADLFAYRKEVGLDAKTFINDLKSGKYSFTITDAERSTVESTVLSYQKDLVKVMKNAIDRAKNNDMKETGDMHFTLRSSKVNINLDVNPYRVVQSRDLKNIEIDMRINMSASGSQIGLQNPITASIDGNIMIIGDDLFVHLRDYSIQPATYFAFAEVKKVLDVAKGKTYHQKLDADILQSIQEGRGSYDILTKLIDILDTQALLTPVAKKGDDYVLMFRRSTAQQISALDHSMDTTGDISIQDLLIPADIRMIGTQIQLQ